MSRQFTILVAVALCIAVGAACVQAAPQFSVKMVTANAADMLNKTVTLMGVASNVKGVNNPFSDYRYEFDLQDTTGTVKVRTTGKPPVEQERHVKVTGVVLRDPDGTYFIGQQGMQIPPWAKWVALGVLVVLAIVLIVLLVRGPRERPVQEVYPAPVDETVPLVSVPHPGGPACANCGQLYAPGDDFCQSCGADLRAHGVREDTSTIMVGGGQQPSGERETVILRPSEPEPIADLIVTEGEGARQGTRIALRKARQKIGRSSSMEIRLSDDTVSREHAMIWWEDDRFFIQDMASTSGTLVNGQKIARQELRDGDEIRMGNTKLVFRMVASK